MIWSNKKMAKLLSKINLDGILEQEYPSIPGISNPIFIEIEDCILLKAENKEVEELNMDFIYQYFGDKTGFEASSNHIHISLYAEKYKGIKSLKLALWIMKIWKLELKKSFPQDTFHLVLSYDGKDSTLRFHKYRENEGTWLIIDGLDGYKGEAILVEGI